MESGLLLDVVVAERATILQLLTRKDKTLLVRRDALLVLDFGLDIVNGVRGFNLESNGLAREAIEKILSTRRSHSMRSLERTSSRKSASF